MEILPQQTYCIFDDFLVFRGTLGKSYSHAHRYIQLGFSRKPVFSLTRTDFKPEQETSSFHIPSGVRHKLSLSGEDVAFMIWLDPEFEWFQPESFSKKKLGDIANGLNHFYDSSLDCETAGRIYRAVSNQTKENRSERDERISNVIKWIKEHLTEQTITAKQLASLVYLSPSRFMHLFSEQTGVPVRNYILWQRQKHALLLLADGENITTAAHDAGFTDSSHMNRTFRRMFGINPSVIFKNSRFIQVYSC